MNTNDQGKVCISSIKRTGCLRQSPPRWRCCPSGFALAVPFFRSGLTKWDGFLSVSPGTQFLFANEFKLHLFGQAFAYPFPVLMSWGASIGEIVLPLLLVLGLFTRVFRAGACSP